MKGGVKMDRRTTHFLLCNGKTCTKKGAEEVTNTIRRTIHQMGLDKTVHTTKTLCNGQCQNGPIVIAYPRGDWFQVMNPTLAKELIIAEAKKEEYKINLLYTYKKGKFLSLG